MSPKDPIPAAADLTFQKAEPLPAESSLPRCVACKQPIVNTYYHAQGQVVCPMCAQRIQSGQQAPPAISMLRAALYGGAAALGGCILYATVSIVTGFEFGLMAIVVGMMVGKAIRYATHGLGGRPQQILAVVLTYFAITTSYIPVFVYNAKRTPPAVRQQQTNPDGAAAVTVESEPRPKVTLASALLYLLMLAAAAPFMSLTSGVSGLISLFIIFIGLQQAWRRTGRLEILVMGPYETTPAT